MDNKLFIGLLDDQPKDPEKIEKPGKPTLISNLQQMVDRLWPLLAHNTTTEPVLISGYWGSGKTSVMKALQSRLNENSKDKTNTRTIWFDAWHYEGQGGLLPQLVRVIWVETQKRKKIDKVKVSRSLYRIMRCAVSFSAGTVSTYAKMHGLGPLGDFVKDLPAGARSKRSASLSV